ncbi:MAG: lysyl oxidase family protein [Saprospiraceae bacterium]
MKLIIPFLLFFGLSFSALAQCDPAFFTEVQITVVTDSFPKEVGWTLSSNDNSKFYKVSPPGTYTESFKTYTEVFCVPVKQCLRLFLTDTKGNGLEYPGYVQVKVNGKLQTSISFFEYAYFEYINCSPGESCGTPQFIEEGKHITDFNNQFFQFTPQANGFYKISTCDTTNTCDTKIWIYEECRTFNPQTNIYGSLLFSDDNGGCGKLAALPKAVLEKDKPYIIRIGGDTCNNTAIKWEIIYNGQITGCMDTAACNYNYLATVPTNDCVPQNDSTCTGPDLIVLADPVRKSMKMDRVNADEDPCLINEGCLNGFGMRDVIRFDTYISNVGDQDYFIGKPYGNLSQFVYDNCHQHYHYRGYAEYLLFDDKGNKIPIGFKAGFCVLDFECADTSNMKYTCVNMGLSNKCTDIYEKELKCQWIDITNTPAGQYTFVSRVNWDNSPDKLGRVESRTDNNWAQVCLEIKRQNDSVWFVIDTVNCQKFIDCKGVKYGSSVRDCKGECGGKSKFGDLNSNHEQDFDDVQKYVNQSVNQSGQSSSCDDLNNDGRISMTDAALLSSCLNYGKRHIHLGSSSYHDHCQFPQKVLNNKDTVYFKIQNYNPSGRYFDIGIFNPSTHVSAYQLKLQNVDINRIISITDTSKYPAKPFFGLGTNIVGSISMIDSFIRKSPSYKPLLRVYFNNNMSSKVEISEISDVIDRDGYGAIGKVEGQPLVIAKSKDLELMDLDVHITPHPVNNEAVLTFYNPENENFTLELFDINGKRVRLIPGFNSSEIKISSDNLPSGLYVYKLSGLAGFAFGKLVVQKNGN